MNIPRIAAFVAGIVVASTASAHPGRMAEKFARADANGDGGLSLAEAAALPRIHRHFAEIDSNRDGVVTLAEIRAWARAKRAQQRPGG